MTLVLWIIRIVVILLVVRLVLRLIRTQLPAGRSAARPSRQVERQGGTLVRDPQCGTYVPQTKAIALSAGGSTAYFCSTGCRDAWAVSHRG